MIPRNSKKKHAYYIVSSYYPYDGESVFHILIESFCTPEGRDKAVYKFLQKIFHNVSPTKRKAYEAIFEDFKPRK